MDTQGIETIPLSFNIANIKDISTTKGSYSKTITVPNTYNNIQVFNDITNLNVESSFDPTKRNRVYILTNSILVFEGYFQLRSFSIDLSQQEQELQLLVSGDNNDFYNVIAEQYITDDDYSELDHIWNSANIKGSWTKTWTHGYFYPLIDYGYNWTPNQIGGATGSVKQNEIFPSTYALYIWNKIFTQAGFKWKGDEFETLMSNLVIPMNTRGIPQLPGFADEHRFIAGFGPTGGQGFFTSYNIFGTGFYDVVNAPPQPNVWTGAGEYIVQRVGFYDETAPFGDPNGLWNPLTHEYTNTATFSINMKFAFNINIVQRPRYSVSLPPQFILRRSTVNGTGTSSIGYITKISDSWNQLTLPVMSLNGTLPTHYNTLVAKQEDVIAPQWTLEFPAQPFDIYNPTIVNPADTYGPWDVFGDTTGSDEQYTCRWNTPTMLIYPGEKVWLEYAYDVAGDIIANPAGSHPFTSYIPAGTLMASINSDSYMANIPDPNVGPGVKTIYNNTLPNKIKKRDFILSIIKMFNLVVVPDVDDDKTLNIYTSDSYYSSGINKDWSMKLDTNSKISGDILGDTQDKKINLKYKDDKDYLNVDYLNYSKISYGEKQYEIDNEFSTGEKTIELVFSPTPLSSISPNNSTNLVPIGGSYPAMILPKIFTVNNGVFQNTESNIRILQKNMIPLTSGMNWRLEGDGYTSGVLISNYPYVGHYDNPFLPTRDINFDQVEGLYYPQINITNNTLFNTYWKRTLDELSDRESRIMTADFFLTEKDISAFRFNDNIFVDLGDGGQYYRVNSIMDYDPANITTTKVELVKVNKITVPISTTFSGGMVIGESGGRGLLGTGFIPNSTPGNNTNLGSGIVISGNSNSTTTSDSNGSGTVVIGDTSNIQGNNIISLGDGNLINGTTNVIMGDDNLIAPYTENNMVVGNNNSMGVNTNSNFIIGNNNLVESGTYDPSSGNVIIGDNQNVSGSNQFIINGMSLQSTSNIVVAGYDEVLSPFNDNNPENYISAGRDNVLGLGSSTIINYINGGRYE